jgi:hypothetical protein
MRRIRFSHDLRGWPVLRQTPGGDGAWRDCVFLPDGAAERDEADYWFVYDALVEPEEAYVAPGRTIFVTAEPEAIRAYEPRFLAQFGLVVTSQRRIEGPNVVHTQPGLPWHVGVRRRSGQGGETLDHELTVLGYEDLRSAEPVKARDLSVVCSVKSHLPGYRLRLEFVERLKEHFGERLDWFGRGVRPIEDKWDAVAPYRFHVSLENAAERDYWTEKLADAYLGGAFPFYWGCPNVDDYFDDAALLQIDPSGPERSIEVIEQALAEGVTPERQAAVARAREQVLDRYNLFSLVASLLDRCPDGDRRKVRLLPERELLPRRPLWRRAAGRARQVLARRG